MKKKIILYSFIILLSIALISSVIIIKINKDKEEKLRQEEIKKQEKIENIENKYSPFINNEYIEEQDELSTFLNNTLDTHKQIEQLTDYKIDINTLKNLDESTKELEQSKEEINKLNYEDINNYLNNYEDYEKEKIIEIYNKSEIVNNIDKDLEKKEEYINNIDNTLNTLDFFKNNTKNYYLKNNKIIYKNNTFLKEYKTYNLNIPIEKEIDYGKAIPILMYHGISDTPYGNSSLFVNVNDFENQMKYLYDNGYTTLFLSQVGLAKNYEKPIIITFDDGYIDNYTKAYPIMKKYNIKSNIFVITRWLDGITYMTPDMVKELSNSGLIEIGSHTMHHVYLGAQSYETQEEELRESKKDLEELLGKEIITIAYPFGSANNNTFTIASKYYKYAVTTNSGYNYGNVLSYLALKRYKIPRGMTLESFKSIVNTK